MFIFVRNGNLYMYFGVLQCFDLGFWLKMEFQHAIGKIRCSTDKQERKQASKGRLVMLH